MQLSQRLSPARSDYWRIVLALASKDIVDAIKNKTTLTMVIGLALVMLTIQGLPLLLKLDSRPRVAIYDAARSGVADTLRQQGDVQVLEMRTAEAARATAVEARVPLLVVILPAGWETGSAALMLDGYIAHSVRPATASHIITQVEEALTAVTRRAITIHTETIYPTLDNGGHTARVAFGLVLATTLITAILVPGLILEEKTSHTLEALRVSPATVNQILLGKAVAGSVYGLLAATVLLAFNVAMVSQWILMSVAVLALVLIGVSIGLLVGTLVENEGAVQMWIALLVLLLVFPLLIVYIGSSRLPAWVQEVAAWFPSTAAFDLIRLASGNTWPPAQVWPRVAAVLIAVIFVFLLTAWRLRTWEH
jgi:ABC-2 type transport system permease protein